MKKFLRRELKGGHQELHRFDNGYGASVICHETSYGGPLGLKELAVVTFNSEEITDFNLTYETPITDDVIGHLSETAVEEILDKIKELPCPAKS